MATNSKGPEVARATNTKPTKSPTDLSVWLIWAAIMLVAIAVLPFAARSHDVARAIARMCGFTLE